MNEKPIITQDCVKLLLDTPYVRVVDLQYAPGAHYYDATRHPADQLTATLTDEEFRAMPADAATCIVIVRTPGEEPRLLLSYEFRYPVGQFLLSPPAGLVDPEDWKLDDPILTTAKREIREETGISSVPTRLEEVSPLVFSTPGLTDESNALVLAVYDLPDLSQLSQKGALGSERFDGFRLLNHAEAERILRSGRDEHGNYYSVYTWCCLMWFVSGMWEEHVR